MLALLAVCLVIVHSLVETLQELVCRGVLGFFDTVSTIVCNWFGAGSAGLADPDSDSSIQSYANIYDTNWLTKGNCMIAPGVERVDTVKTDSGYEMKSIWSRNDLSDTSILKLSTATGYIYGICRYFSATTIRDLLVIEGKILSDFGVTNFPSFVMKRKFAPPVSST